MCSIAIKSLKLSANPLRSVPFLSLEEELFSGKRTGGTLFPENPIRTQKSWFLLSSHRPVPLSSDLCGFVHLRLLRRRRLTLSLQPKYWHNVGLIYILSGGLSKSISKRFRFNARSSPFLPLALSLWGKNVNAIFCLSTYAFFEIILSDVFWIYRPWHHQEIRPRRDVTLPRKRDFFSSLFDPSSLDRLKDRCPKMYPSITESGREE